MSTEIIDFTNDMRIVSNYDGAAEKIRIMHGGTSYMLKFGEQNAPDNRNPLKASYHNTPVCEWLGCHVFEACGIPVQETLLGTYNGRSVVACKDFISDDPRPVALLPFSNIENSVTSSSERGRYPSIESMEKVFSAYDGLHGHKRDAGQTRSRETSARATSA